MNIAHIGNQNLVKNVVLYNGNLYQSIIKILFMKYNIFEYSNFGLTMIYNKIIDIYENKIVKLWRYLPYRFQSILLIGLWIIVPSFFINEIYTRLTLNQLSWIDIPTIMLIIMLLPMSWYFIILDIKGKLKH